MVEIHVKQSDQRQFLYECPATRSVDIIIRDIVSIHNLQSAIQNLVDHGEQLILYGTAKPQDTETSDADNSKLRDSLYNNPSGRRTGEACDPTGAETLRRTLTEADAYVSKNQVLHKIPLALNALKDHIENIRAAVMICYPMGLPSCDPVQQLLDGTFGGEELFDLETAQLWWAGKELMRDKKLSDRVGKNEKTKIIAKLQARGHGPPTREPPVDAEILKAMMTRHKKEEEA
ncbi:hypothetical protein SUGI_0028210 [Cryptomeria japonica]|uniref:uncharacterized protein LOC131042911 n=1 Tax=Cryptomeria japonica TaxID=3369 RepID=UPI002408A350|nr:uncharacterized protein LOC131042911 [Cryptomeria japonica]GLJ05919.1 hypothetical protein SUGI_0028210 [Cryptomeria japonica]